MPLEAYIAGGVVCGLLLVWLAYKRSSVPNEAKFINRLQTVVERLEAAANSSENKEQQINNMALQLVESKGFLCSLGEKIEEQREKLQEIHELNKDYRLILGPLIKGILKDGKATITVEYDENGKIKVEPKNG